MGVNELEKYIIFGAGHDGRALAKILGPRLIECFIDNNIHGTTIDGIRVHSLKNAVKLYPDTLIIVTSYKYAREMIAQLISEGIDKYVVYGEPVAFPQYVLNQELHMLPYEEVLKQKRIDKFSKIVIYGENLFIKLLIEKINELCGKNAVIGVVGNHRHDGITYIELNEALEVADCILINAHRNDSDIRYRLINEEMDCSLVDLFDVDSDVAEFHHKNIEKYKNIYKGKRCFLIGNGPSLSPSDLDKLYENEEICFACNKINLIFPKTKWRPNYYAMSDGTGMLMLKDTLDEIDCVKFIADYYEMDKKYEVSGKNVEYLHYQFGGMYNHPGFSFDPTNYTCEGGTALYDICLQMAVYMGFSDIYLLGVDNTIMEGENDHFDESYFSDDVRKEYEEIRQINAIDEKDDVYNQINRCFEVAQYYMQRGYFNIYNATRGGKLNVLERVNFDELFS